MEFRTDHRSGDRMGVRGEGRPGAAWKLRPQRPLVKPFISRSLPQRAGKGSSHGLQKPPLKHLLTPRTRQRLDAG